MKPNLVIVARLTLLLPLLPIGTIFAQSVAPTAAEVAKYDANRNGRLDPEELATRDADQRAALRSDEPLVISPFEVKAEGRGYYSANSMSGTRLNSKIEDLAASLTVVTKEQMSDFAMLDVNDIFLYEAGTEGTGTFSDIEFDRNGTPIDNTQLDPNNANRMRGVGPANISFGNYETSGRVPVDPINIDAVEISRGPNANVFGLGNAAGTVNMQPATANLGRSKAQVGLRADSFEGWRTSLDVNRVLKKDVLALRGSVVFQHDGFDRKPSGTDSTRLNGMVKYQPFKNTTIRGMFSRYHIEGNRPNTSTPRDFVSNWINAGRPTYDPITGRVRLNGAQLPTVYTTGNIANTGYFTQFAGVNTVYVDGDGAIRYWSQSRTGASATDPDASKQNVFLAITTPEPIRTGQPLFASDPPVSSKALYDWSKVNIAAMNWLDERTDTMNLELEQIVFNTPRHLLALSAGFFREDSERFRREVVGSNTDVFSGNLYVDPNERLIDGSPNPFVGRTYLGARFPTWSQSPLERSTYRGQLAYRLDLRNEKNVLRWLGMHQLSAYGEYKEIEQRRQIFRDVITSNHAWLPASASRANTAAGGGLPASPNATRNWFNYYVGDNVGANIDYAPTHYAYGNYTFVWGNGVTGVFNRENATLGPGEVGSSGATNNTRQIIKTEGAVLQSYFLRDRVVTTVGLRRDRSYNRFGAPGRYLPGNGVQLDPALFTQWAPGDWATIREGDTKTAGAVVKPLRWLHVHVNVSDSFRPADVRYDLHLQPLPDPKGEGKDYGFTLNLFDGKLITRVNRYETKQLNARGSAPQIAGRTRVIDFETQGFLITGPDPFNLVERATRWATTAAEARGQTLTADQLVGEVSRITGLGAEYITSTDRPTGDFATIGDVVAKGTEIEINYNPTNFWTLKANFTKQASIDSNLSADVSNWINERMPHWTSIVDPETNDRFWTHAGYNPSNPVQTPQQWFEANVIAPLKIAQATEGKSKPQIRKYRANLSTSYRLAGLTDQKHLKRVTIGGAVRWEDKGAIGYYGVERLPAVITALDPHRPVWDKARAYADAFVSYRTRLFRDKVGTLFQLNVRNLQENGRLQATRAYPDGRPSSYRIVDPRQFIFSATFDL